MSDTKGTATKQKGFWARLNKRGKMYFVLALCCAALLLTVAASMLIIHRPGGTAADEGVTVISSESLVADSAYDKDQNIIDTAEYTTTILEQSEDAGQSYLDETLFLGDSNTARMYRMFSYCTYGNAIGSVGMSARQLDSYACVKFDGYSGYKTMPEAVALLQPQRVIITFGTNDLNPNTSAATFISGYQQGIEAVQAAYPSVDIIINSIPPLGKEHAGSNLTQSQVDEYNKAIVQMCKDMDWKYLNTAETLKDAATGYAKAGYTENSDGIHLTSAAMDAMFDYIRTHSYITEDDRPALTSIPAHTDDKDVVVYTAPVVATAAPTEVPTEVPAEEPTEQPVEQPEGDTADIVIDSGSNITYTYWDEVIAPTETSGGYTIHHCNEDSSKDYTDSYTDPLPAAPVETPVPEVTEVPAPETTTEPVAELTATPLPEITATPIPAEAPVNSAAATDQIQTG